MIKKDIFIAFASITLLLLILASCRSAKYLEDDQALVTKVKIEGVSPELKEDASAYISTEVKPNSRLNLTIYNWFNTKDGRYKRDGIRNVGEAPHVLDSSLVELSATQINRFLQTRGYFNAIVEPVAMVKNKKAILQFDVALGQPFRYGKITHHVVDSRIDTIYAQAVLPYSKAKPGEQFNSGDLLDERERLYTKLKELGYYEYLRQYMRVGIDTNTVAKQANLHVDIQNPSENDTHVVYYIDSVSATVRLPYGQTSNRKSRALYHSISKIQYKDETGRFKLAPLARYMYVRSGMRYNLKKEIQAYDRLYEMNGFRNVKINYQKVDSNRLHVAYELTPRPVMANQVEGEFTFSSGMSGFNVGNTFSHRNVFGGAEQLEVKARYGVLFDPRLDGSLASKIFNNDFQIGVNLIVPRLMTPFENSSSGTYGLPRTTFSSTVQLFQQDGTYSNRYFTNTLNYIWYSDVHAQHSLTPISIEYRQGRLNDDFARRLEEEGYRLYIRSNNREYFGLGAQYAFTYNAKRLLRLEDFNYFRLGLESSGNLLGLAANLFQFNTSAEGEKLLFGVPYLQYAKAELDYRWYKHLSGNRQFVLRFNGGVAVPYGNNSQLLIFEKSFYGGGMNGIRAWQARTLGPGNYDRSGLQNEQLRLNLRNLDQLGEVKLEANAEYRFRLLNKFLGAKLNGATFLDAGNIWLLRDNEFTTSGEGTFRADRFLSQIALGTGFGLRLDMDYFMIRLDAGLKLKDPQFKGSNQWVIKEFFNAGEFKRQFYEARRPDRYNFIQYNFSVGLPF
ncbi:translocation and assembly module lipoprotein TamL [Sphingobacterium paludis]|uniref:Outer membrane protein assembly factor BamA n=1 Tax=Sphingobacterium paludis TaxID=1476465 RepID=A0A4R7D6Q6_9SPHI|nr:BamA/TamA family outer membrane protein [Sphingobacterium paludis]TDS16277.1 outer membrane protein assembly factor BamA [Sphingobacterium paludis]